MELLAKVYIRASILVTESDGGFQRPAANHAEDRFINRTGRQEEVEEEKEAEEEEEDAQLGTESNR